MCEVGALPRKSGCLPAPSPVAGVHLARPVPALGGGAERGGPLLFLGRCWQLQGRRNGPGSGSQVSTGVGDAAEPHLESGPPFTLYKSFAEECKSLVKEVETMSLGFFCCCASINTQLSHNC